MLLSLHVKNLALIDEMETYFKEGLNILTGETGAGKSIIIGSINFALGEKVSKDMVRNKEKQAVVELVFQVEQEKQKIMLEDLGIIIEESQVILTRKIVNGRSISKINGESVSISDLKEAARILIDIHGQHEHQSLLHSKKHLEILDEFGKVELESKKLILEEHYKQYMNIKKALEQSSLDEEARVRELAFLQFEVEEIEHADLVIGEDDKLEEKYKKLVNFKKISSVVQAVSKYTHDGPASAQEQVGRSLKDLHGVVEYDGQLEVIQEQLGEIENLLSDFNRDLLTYMTDIQFDEKDFYDIEERMNLINRLKAKYGKSTALILEEFVEKKQRIEQLSNYEQYYQGLVKQYDEAKGRLEKICKEISSIRKKYAKELIKQVKEGLRDLNFLDVIFEMEFRVLNHYNVKGLDEVEFLISTNPGETARPLQEVASGGELSRIMLAIKAVLAENDEIDTLIFDEIDTGISGRTAQMVSEKMSIIGKKHQVICITHLPQIAAMADVHFLIEKSVNEKITITSIKELEEKDSVLELARLLGGVKITKAVIQNAKEMKELALSTKKS